MTPQEFIKEHINVIAEKFPFLKYSCYRDEIDGTHFILVSPSEFFEQFDDEFVTFQNKVILEFIQLYPTQSLAFVCDEELFEGEEPVFVIESCKSSDSEMEWFDIDRIFASYEPDFSDPSYSFKELNKLNQSQIITGFDIKFSEGHSPKTIKDELNSSIDQTSIDSVNSEFDTDDFYLAA